MWAARARPRGAHGGALTAFGWAHCGAAHGARGARPGAGGGRTRVVAATSLQERAAGVMAWAGEGAGGPFRPGRPLGAVLTAAPPCPRAPDRTGQKLGRRGAERDSPAFPPPALGENAWDTPARALGIPDSPCPPQFPLAKPGGKPGKVWAAVQWGLSTVRPSPALGAKLPTAVRPSPR